MTIIEQHISGYLRRLRSLNYSPSTLRTSKFILRWFRLWLADHGVHSTDVLRGRHLDTWQEALSQRMSSASGKPLKPRAVNKKIEVVKGFLKYLVSVGAVSSALIERVQYVKEPKMLPGSVLTHAQACRLLKSVATDTPEGYRNRTMFELLYSSGMRVGELLGLDIGVLDIEGRTAIVMGKGRKERVVPFGATAAKILETYLKVIRPHFVTDTGEKALFLDAAGRRLPYYTFRRIVRACAENSGIDVHVTAHTFRRSCTTELLRGGANMYHVKELLGHESLETIKHYARLTITDLKRTHRKCHPRERDASR